MSKYIVTARVWDAALKTDFGLANLEHEITDKSVIEYIVKHGRASIDKINSEDDSLRYLNFENDYD